MTAPEGAAMPLLDHFRPPLVDRRDWHSFHHAWAAQLAGDLNDQTPDEFFAEPNVKFGIEIDVGTFEEPQAGVGGPGGWSPPAADAEFPFLLTDAVAAVEVYRQFGGRVLCGVVELVSPANKDRPASHAAFVSKCETFLRAGVGVVVVDVVTERHADLHALILERSGAGRPPLGSDLYAAAYRPTGTSPDGRLAVWERPLAVGEPLPSLPLWLPVGLCLEVRLEETYQRTLRQLKIRPPQPAASSSG
jgi:hypothetical protein